MHSQRQLFFPILFLRSVHSPPPFPAAPPVAEVEAEWLTCRDSVIVQRRDQTAAEREAAHRADVILTGDTRQEACETECKQSPGISHVAQGDELVGFMMSHDRHTRSPWWDRSSVGKLALNAAQTAAPSSSSSCAPAFGKRATCGFEKHDNTRKPSHSSRI